MKKKKTNKVKKISKWILQIQLKPTPKNVNHVHALKAITTNTIIITIIILIIIIIIVINIITIILLLCYHHY